jgi:hypothetical protein
VHVAAGQQVGMDQPLVEVAPAAAGDEQAEPAP